MPAPNPAPTYLQDANGNAWLATVTDQVVPILMGGVPVPPGIPVLPFIYLNDTVTGLTWRVVATPSALHPTAPPSRFEYVQVPTIGAPTQLLVTAPNGIVYALQITNGRLDSAFVSPSSFNCLTPISILGMHVQDRLEEPRGPGIFWNLTMEVYTAIVEAMNDMMILVGRPTQVVNTNFNLAPNTVWQQIPKGVFLITDLIGAANAIRKVSLFSMDYIQSSWGSDWENDTSPNGPVRWGPVGMTQFFVHPAPSVPVTIQMNAIAYPVAESWPYIGTETVPFQHEFHEALEMYASHYCRLKEMGSEFKNSMDLYMNYLALAERMTMIEDKKDDLVFSRSFGAIAGLNPLTRR